MMTAAVARAASIGATESSALRRRIRATRITPTTCAAAKTHSDITVDVARNTSAGVTIVAATSSAAWSLGTSRWRVKSNQHAAARPAMASIEINLSHTKLSGYDGLTRNT